MDYYIYQLQFTTPVRFGSSNYSINLTNSNFYADSSLLFSAISSEWVQLYGISSYNNFLAKVKNDEFILSSLLPYYKDELYVPKPILHINKNKINAKNDEDSKIKKEMKKIKFIPVSHLNDYINFLKGEKSLQFEYITEFAFENRKTQVEINDYEDNLPYYVSSYTFNKNCGLYFIVQTSDDIKEKLDVVIKSLGMTGIGGKKSSGYGKFNLTDDAYILDEQYPLYNCDVNLHKHFKLCGDYYLALSLVKPTNTEIEQFEEKENFYKLTKKSGFIYSKTYADTLQKKKDTYFFDMGSCLKNKMHGEIVDVSSSYGSHSVYLNGKGMYIGVKL